jgi:cytochrome c-type biogenesis protein CcmE
MNGKIKLALAGTISVVVVLYLTSLFLSTSWQYYLLVDECREQPGRFYGKRLRVSGKVAGRSLTISVDRRKASFVLAGHNHQIRVNCSGPLPDNLSENIDVVVEGVLQEDGHLQGQRVITRCASKYAPKDNSGS